MILDKFRLDGKVALVTGGTKGLGKAIALALAEAGADVAVVSRTRDAEVENAILRLERRYAHLALDLTQRENTRMVIPAVVESMGYLDILVNNAGIIRRASALEYSESDWDATLEIDLTATFLLSQAAARAMLARGGGKIINVASVLALQGGMNVVAYATAKHGVAGLTQALANDLASKGINVNAIAPSFFETGLTAAVRADPHRSASITARTPAGRWGTPEDIAGAAVFLASSASDFVHGAILPVDGGWMAW
jgi:2-dehydro-3-deoxy-D-gluconate 5-dehydrogenase